jgi:cell division protein FtsZ
MASGKRASMREGPLAALFRRTDEEEGGPEEGRRGEEPREAAKREQRQGEGHKPARAGEGARSRQDREADLRAQHEERSAVHARPERRAPEPEPPELPTPEERLRNVFSPDIPENILERAPRFEPSFSTVTATHTPMLRVVGVGGAGVNAVDRMIEAEVEGVDFIAINTDLQSLEYSRATEKLRIGGDLTKGLGSGSDPELGRHAALEEYDRIKALLKGADMVFVTAGAGGGTGTGGAPVIARISREVGALTVGIVTKPFGFEGARRGEQAEQGIEELSHEVDTLIVIPNARLLSVLDKKTSMVDAFRVADDVLRQGVQGISDLITLPGLINLDFADVRTIMSEAGQALLGIGMGVGEQRAMDAAVHAVESPLLETSVEGARSILFSITGGHDLSLWEVNEAARAVAEAAHPDANIIFGAMVDEKLIDQVWVTVVATGYGDHPIFRAAPSGEREPARLAARQVDREPRVRRGREAEAREAEGRDVERAHDRQEAGGEREARVPPPGESSSNGLGDIDVPEFLPGGRR